MHALVRGLLFGCREWLPLVLPCGQRRYVARYAGQTPTLRSIQPPSNDGIADRTPTTFLCMGCLDALTISVNIMDGLKQEMAHQSTKPRTDNLQWTKINHNIF